MDDPNLLRIGTKERDEALKLLGDHFTEGRLPIAEYDERVSRAIEAETRGDIKSLFGDLPPPYPAFLAPAPPPQPLPPPPVMYPHYPVEYGLSDRNKITAGVLQLLLPFGIGRFYMGNTGVGVAQLLTCFVGFGIFWCWIDGILLLINGGIDGQGRRLRG